MKRPLTARATRVLMLAEEEARRRGHAYVGTEHILLGLIREGEGIGAGVLESLDVSDRVRQRIDLIIGSPKRVA